MCAMCSCARRGVWCVRVRAVCGGVWCVRVRAVCVCVLGYNDFGLLREKNGEARLEMDAKLNAKTYF